MNRRAKGPAKPRSREDFRRAASSLRSLAAVSLLVGMRECDMPISGAWR
jgi:hypothetical protein